MRTDAAARGLALASLLAAAGAGAAEALPDLVVTATRTAQSAFDLPASIDRIDADPDGPGVQLADSLAGVPGVLARSRQNFAQDEQISIRGFGARASFGVRGIRLYTDGIPATMPDGQGQTAHFDLDGAQRIEVLRGPFSALYGNSSGGVIQLFTRDGADDPGAWARAGAGSFGTARLGAGARGGDEGAAWGVGATAFHTDGFRDHSDADRYKGSAQLRIGTPDALRFTAQLNFFVQPEALDPQGLTAAQYAADPEQAAPSALAFRTRKSVRQHQLGALLEQALGDRQRWQVLGYAGTRHIVQFLSVPAAAQASPTSSGGVVDLDSRYGGADLRWTWTLGALDLVAGAGAEAQRQHRRGYENFVGAELGVQGAPRRDEDNDARSLDQYVQATWRLGERWLAAAGVRHSDVRFSSDDHYVATGNPDDSGSRSFSQVSPVAGISFAAAPAWRVYAAYGRGFETPTANELAYRADGSGGFNTDLDAARSHHAEAGSKLRLPGGGRLDAAVFAVRTRDELAAASSSGGRTVFGNVDSRRRGAELLLVKPLPAGLRVESALTVLDAELESGRRMPGVPHAQGFAALSWTGAAWRATLELRAQTRVAVDDANAQFAAGHALLGAGVSHRSVLGRHRLRVYVEGANLLDRRHVGSVIVNEANGRFFEPGPSRAVFAGIALEAAGI